MTIYITSLLPTGSGAIIEQVAAVETQPMAVRSLSGGAPSVYNQNQPDKEGAGIVGQIKDVARLRP